MSDIPTFPYSMLWGERILRSVANLTRHSGGRIFSTGTAVLLVSN